MRSRAFRRWLGCLALWPAASLTVGVGSWWIGRSDVADWIWAGGVVPVLIALAIQIVISLRQGEVGLDVVALLSMGGALVLGEPLAGNVVALMYAGGELLENFADNRARRELKALLARAPKSAMKYGPAGLIEVDIGNPCARRSCSGAQRRRCCRWTEQSAVPPRSSISRPSPAKPCRCVAGNGEAMLSGSVNADAAFDIVATKRAAESAYAGIVRLVEAAQGAKAPMVRLADRYAIWFLLVTVVVAGAAWIATGDPIRALAVLVVATPCPLILAVPVAIVSGVSLAARHGVLVKGGGVLEDPRTHQCPRHRQDRDADCRTCQPCRQPRDQRFCRERRAPICGLTRSGVQSCCRRSAGSGGTRTRTDAVGADRCAGSGRRGHRRAR